MTTTPAIIWTAELRATCGEIVTRHHNSDIVSRAHEIWHGAKVGAKLSPMNVEFVTSMRSRFCAADAADRQVEHNFNAAWGDAYDAALERSSITLERTPMQTDIINLPLSPADAHALLRLIATANDAERTANRDRQTGTWIAERLLKLVDPEAGQRIAAHLTAREG
jgi:hypothetical protein